MRPKGMVQTRKGLTLLHQFSPEEAVVGIVNYRDDIFIATTNGLYRVVEADDDECMTVTLMEIMPND